MDHAAGPVRPARTRLVTVVLLVGLLAVALLLAPHLAAGTGPGMLRPDTTWLPSVLESLAEYWNSLPLARQIAVEIALGAMFALVMGPIGWGVAGVLTWGLSHGAGLVTFARDPHAATADYLANLTPAQLAADGLDLLLTFAPGNFASGSRAVARNLAHTATATPLAVVAARRNLIDHGLPAHAPPPPPAHPSAGWTHPPTGPGDPQTWAPSASPGHPQAGPTPGSPTGPGHAVPAQTPTPGLTHPPTSPTHPPAGPPTTAHPQPTAAQPPPRPVHPEAPAAPTVRPTHPVDPTPAPASTRGDLPATTPHAGRPGTATPTGPHRPPDNPGAPTAHPADSPAPLTRPADQPATATPRPADQAPTSRPDTPAVAHGSSDVPALPSRQDPTIAIGPPVRFQTAAPATPQSVRPDLPTHYATPAAPEPSGTGAGSRGGPTDSGNGGGHGESADFTGGHEDPPRLRGDESLADLTDEQLSEFTAVVQSRTDQALCAFSDDVYTRLGELRDQGIVTSRRQEALFLRAELSPAYATVYNPRNGEFYCAINNFGGEGPLALDPRLAGRIANMPEGVRAAHRETSDGLGSHAEVHALNDALRADPTARLEDLIVDTRRTGLDSRRPAGEGFAACPHCAYIIDGTHIIHGVAE